MLDSFLNTVLSFPGELSFAFVLLVLILCGVGLPLPEELLIVASAYLAHQEVISIETAIVGVIIGMLIGDSLLFLIGYRVGPKIFESRFFKKMMTPERMKKTNDYFHRWGSRVVFVARFVMGLRATVFLTAGVLRMPFRRFLLLDGLAAIISVPLNIYVVYKLLELGRELDETLRILKGTGRGMLALVVTGIIGTSLIIYFRSRARKAKQSSTET